MGPGYGRVRGGSRDHKTGNFINRGSIEISRIHREED
jgi:hypothetical protein